MTRRLAMTLLVAVSALAAGTVASLVTGSFRIAPGTVVDVLLHPHAKGIESEVIFNIRLPRVAAACVGGWALALAGLVFQALLRNPLASEYTLGVSSGASLGAVGAALLQATSPVATPIGAFGGALAAIVFVLFVARARLSFDTNATIMTGVIFTSLSGAALSLILSIVSPNELHTFFFWFMGSFANAEWATLLPVAGAVTALSLIVYSCSWDMNALAVGEDFAAQVGVRVEWTKGVLFVAASLLAALIVSIAGTVGFVGLVVPHAARMAIGADHRHLVPVAAVGGAALCVAADLLARTLLAPNELPAGVVTAFVGVPVFVTLMRRVRA